MSIDPKRKSKRTVLFNDNWMFHKGDIPKAIDKDFDDAGWRKLDLPHDWSIEGPFEGKWASATGYLPAGIGWYRKTFVLPSDTVGKKVFIEFDGVYKDSEVWINGHYLGKRPNGFVPFGYEITRYLKQDGNNTVAVKVDHSEFADSRWYTGSGIYRNVYLVTTDLVSIDRWGIGFSTPEVSPEKATAKVSVLLTNGSSEGTDVVVTSRLLDSAGKQVACDHQALTKIMAGSNAKADFTFEVTAPTLWTVDDPALYTLEVSLTVGAEKIDELTQQAGFRSIESDKDKGFFLNGKSMKLKGLCIHDDAGALGVAVPEEVWARRLQILKAGGCNSLRMSHNPHADYLYDLCDQMGFLVMDEAFDEWEIGKNKWVEGWNVGQPDNHGYHQHFKEWADRDIRDMVLRNRNHPSIIMWSIGNEVDYPNDPYTHPILDNGRNPQIYGRGYRLDRPSATRLTEIAKQLVIEVKRYDTTRPVTAALAGVVMSNEVGPPEVLDIVGYNYQEFRYPEDREKYPDRVIYGSENGHQLAHWTAVTGSEAIAGQYLWTGIDYLGLSGRSPAVASAQRAVGIDLASFPKPQYYFRQSLWSDKPMVYLGTVALTADRASNLDGKWSDINAAAPFWNYKVDEKVRINCFTNCAAAELFLNGQSLGRKLLSDFSERVLSWDTNYRSGQLIVNGYNNDQVVTTSTLKTAGEPDAIKAEVDHGDLGSDTKQLVHIEINITDRDGNPVCDAENEIMVTVEGPIQLLGLESGSASSHEDYKSNRRKAVRGKLLAYLQSQQKSGNVKVNIASAGLKSKTITLNIR